MNTHYLTPYELHQRWSFHVESIRRMVREGRIPAIRIGKRVRVALADVEAYEASNRKSHGKKVPL